MLPMIEHAIPVVEIDEKSERNRSHGSKMCAVNGTADAAMK